MFTRFLAAAEPALWTIACGGRIEGCLVREAGLWRLSWFDGADRRLRQHGVLRCARHPPPVALSPIMQLWRRQTGPDGSNSGTTSA